MVDEKKRKKMVDELTDIILPLLQSIFNEGKVNKPDKALKKKFDDQLQRLNLEERKSVLGYYNTIYKGVIAERKKLKKQGLEEFKVGGHLVDNFLNPKTRGITLFGDLEESNKQEVLKSSNMEVKDKLGNFLEFSRLESSVIYALSNALDEQENASHNPIPENLEKLALTFTPYQITKFVYGNSPSGKNIKDVLNTLKDIAQKNVVIHLKEERKEGKATIRRDVKKYTTLMEFTVAKEEREEGENISAKTVLQVKLNKVFFKDKSTKWAMMPQLFKIGEAYGSSNYPKSVLLFFSYISQAKTNATKFKKDENGNRLASITKSVLFEKVNPKYFKEKRFSQISKEVDRAIDAAKKLGYIKGVSFSDSKAGERLYIFHL